MPNPWLNEHKSTSAMNYFLNKVFKNETLVSILEDSDRFTKQP
jgi:hypothetical protein